MDRDFKLYLKDILRYGAELQLFLGDLSFEEYERNTLVRRAVERCFEIIGEAVSQARDQNPEVKEVLGEHRQIVNFRNRIIHGYFCRG